MTNKIIVAITGATGIVYGIKALSMLKEAGVRTHLVMSESARKVIGSEHLPTGEDWLSLAGEVYLPGQIDAPIASGSYKTDGMLIAPCTVKTLGEIAAGIGSSLISRAADVTLKERRRLVLMVRETPLNLIHIRNMESVTQAGGIIMPPVPALYTRARTIDDIVTHTVGRALDLLGYDMKIPRWE